MKKIYFLTVLFLSLSMALLGQSSPCPLQIHLERTLGYTNNDYRVYYYVGYDYNPVYLVLDAETESFDTTLLLEPDTRFELYTARGGSDFVCRITDGSGSVFQDSYYPRYTTPDPCSPVCLLSVEYGCVNSLENISTPWWLSVDMERGDGYWTSLFNTYDVNITGGETHYDSFFVSLGNPLHFEWTNPAPDDNFYFFIVDNSTGDTVFRKNVGQHLDDGYLDFVYTPNCGGGGGNGGGGSTEPTECPLVIHLERTLGESSNDYGVAVNGTDAEGIYFYSYIMLDAETESLDTILTLLPHTWFSLETNYNYGGSDFFCTISDESEIIYEGGYYPFFRTLDPCSPLCTLTVAYGSTSDIASNYPYTSWIYIYSGSDTVNYWDYLENYHSIYAGGDYSHDFHVTSGEPLHFRWTNPAPGNNDFFFFIIDNATGDTVYSKNAGEYLPDGYLNYSFTPNCGGGEGGDTVTVCDDSNRCPLNISVERTGNAPNGNYDYVLEYTVNNDVNNIQEFRIGPGESHKDTTLMLCPGQPFELHTLWTAQNLECTITDAHGDETFFTREVDYLNTDPCSQSCELMVFMGADEDLSNINDNWLEVYEDNNPTPMAVFSQSSVTVGDILNMSLVVHVGHEYHFVWHDPDPINSSSYFYIENQSAQEIFSKSTHESLTNGEVFTYTPTCTPMPVITDYVDNIEANSATCQGIVYPDAFDDYVPGTPMVYGYCCGTTTNPTIGNAVAQDSYNNTDMYFTTTITGLQPNTTYYVRAYVIYHGEVYYGNELSFTTTAAADCNDPTILGFSNNTGYSIVASWTVANSAMPISSYKLQYKKVNDEGDVWNEISNINATQYTLTNLTPNTQYYIRVQTVCAPITSHWAFSTFRTAIPQVDHLYVTTTGTGDGSSWANAMGDLSDALDMAAEIRRNFDTTVTIWVAAGTYYGDVDSTNAFKMKEGVNVYGGFAGNEPVNYDLSLRDFTTNATILDGQNSRRVLYQEGSPTRKAIWDGLTIQHGQIEGPGAGAYLRQAFEMRNCRFLHNTSISGEGGALYLYPLVLNPSFKFLNCEFSYNESWQDGVVHVNNNALKNNINVETANLGLEFRNCDFLHNHGSSRSVLTDQCGGTILADNGLGILDFINCKFKYNTSSSYYTIIGGRSFVNCEISDNKARQAAGLAYSSASLWNCSIVNNEDSLAVDQAFGYADGSGLAYFSGTLTNCVVWGNKVAGEHHNIYLSENMTIQNCAIEVGYEGNDNSNVIVLQRDNYGSVRWLHYPFFVCPENGDYRLRNHSAMVDAGMDYPGIPAQDLAGADRVYDGTVDIGCYEYHDEDYCTAPVAMQVQNITGTSASIVWQNSNPETAWYYELSYKAEGEANWTVYPEQIHAQGVVLTGLQSQTTYTVRLRCFCGTGDNSAYSPELNFTTSSCTDGNIHTTIADEVSGFTFFGFDLGSEYSYSQQIFTADEIHTSGTIDTLWFQHDQTSQVAVRNVNIYLAHTLKSEFESIADWIPVNQYELVYSGEIRVDCAADGTWIPIPLQTPFDYNGVNNLALVIDDNTGSYIKFNYPGFKAHWINNKTTIYHSAYYDIDPEHMSTFYLTLGSTRMNVKFAGPCATGGCNKASLSVVDVTPMSATLVFEPGANASSCEMQYREFGTDNYISLPTDNSPYNLLGLHQNTTYEVRVRSVCGPEYGIWKSVLFHTEMERMSKIYVTETGNGNGSSWERATGDLNWALNTAAEIKEYFGSAPDIWVAGGTYYGDTAHSEAFVMEDGVNVYGGFAGDEGEDFDLSQRDFDQHPTILDGQHVMYVLNQNGAFFERTIWDGLTIRNGGYIDEFGNHGAGAYISGTVSMYNCVFTENSGVGLNARGKTYNNRIDSVFIRNCVFSHNEGGGANLSTYVWAEDCAFEYNTSRYGAGLELTDHSMLRNSKVKHNTATYGGGGVSFGGASIVNCEITHNVAGGEGGGVNAANTIHTDMGMGIINCLIANNTAKKGAGVSCDGVSQFSTVLATRVYNTTIVNNEIVSDNDEDLGAGIYGSPELVNCIIWGNKRNGYVEGLVKRHKEDIVLARYVASDDPIEGENNILLFSENRITDHTALLHVPVTYANGMYGPHFVHPSESVGASDSTVYVNWRLRPASPCSNRGAASVVSNSYYTENMSEYVKSDTINLASFVSTDLDGNDRVQQDTIDLGCYESIYNSVALLPLPDSIVYVREGGFGTRIGDSWENAAGSIQDAIRIAAMRNARVWVAAGTYYGDNPDGESAFLMKEGVNVYGGFAGNEPPTFNLDDRDFTQNVSILDGQQRQRVLYQVRDFVAEDSVVWDGFTIQNGRVNGAGAGVFMRQYSRLRNCIVQYNMVEGIGDDLYGNGIYAAIAPKYMPNGYYHLDGRIKISHCKIVNNGSEANTASATGGGLYAYVVEIDHTEIAHNTASSGAGVYAKENVFLSNCLIHHNTATRYGGGLWAAKDMYVVSCNIVNNTVKRSEGGGGIYYDYYGYYDTLFLVNCIVWGNKYFNYGSYGQEQFTANNIVKSLIASRLKFNYCAVEGGFEGTGNMALAAENDRFNGEEFYPRFMDPAHGDYRLHPLSSCIDKGNNAFVDAAWDIYGNMRIRDSLVDFGCVETDETECPTVNSLRMRVFCDSVKLMWNRGLMENQWLLSYGEMGGDTTTILVYDTVYTLYNLSSGHNYITFVRSVCDEVHQSEPSLSANFHVPSCLQADCAPVPSMMVNVLDTSVVLSWNRGGEESQWLLSYGEEGETPIELMLSDTVFTLMDLIQGHSYTAYVFAICNDIVVSDTSVWVNFVAPTIPLVCPSVIGLTAEVGADVVSLTWDREEGVNRWIVTWGLAGMEQTRDTVSNNIHVLSNLLWDVDYTVSVCALCNDTLTGDDSPVLTFRVASPPIKPDLHVTQITNSAPFVRSTMTVTWTVRNDGNAATPPGMTWDDYIWLSFLDGVSGGFWIGAKEMLLATVPNLHSLEPGESYTNTATVTIPEDFVGTYYLFVLSDIYTIIDIDYSSTGDTIAPDPYTPSLDGNPYPYLSGVEARYHERSRVQEINNGDNFFYKVINVLTPPVPDLVVTSISSYPSDVFSGNEIPLTWTVSNQGEVLAEGSWIDKVYLSLDSSFSTNNSILLGTYQRTGGLLPDSSYQRSVHVTIPISCRGDYYIYIYTDQTNTVFESLGEVNNIGQSSQPMHVNLSPYPDLVVTDIDMPETVSANGQLICHYTVTNIGYGPTYVSGWYDDGYIISQDSAYNVSHGYDMDYNLPSGSHYHSGILNPGESYTAELRINVPSDAYGEWTLYVQADEHNSVFEYDADTNNVSSATFLVSPPDLAVTNVLVPDTVWSGSVIPVSYTIRNISEGTAYRGAFEHPDNWLVDSIYIGSTPDSYANGEAICMRVVRHNGSFRLLGGEEQVFTENVTIPDGLNGPVYAFVRFNARKQLNENNQYANNLGTSSEFTALLSPWPDIHVTNITVPPVVYTQSPFTIEYTVRNDGIAALNSEVTHGFIYTNNPYVDPGQSLSSTVRENLTLAVGEEVTKTAEITMGRDAGFYYLHMFVDKGNNVYEYTGESNNHVVSNQYEAINYPLDLAVMEIEGPDTVQWGQTVNYRMKVKNLSNVPSLYPFDQLFNLVGESGYTIGRLIYGVTQDSIVQAGAEYWVPFEFEVPYGSPGTVYLNCTVKRGYGGWWNAENPDVDMSNNEMVKRLTVNSVPLPDLAIMGVAVEGEVYAGQPAHLTYMVKNVGEYPVVAQRWKDVLWYEDTLSSIRVNVQILNTVWRENMTLYPGESIMDTIEFILPMPPIGDNSLYQNGKTLLLAVNKDNAFYEHNRNNNETSIHVQVNNRPPGDLIVTDVVNDNTVISGGDLHVQWNVRNVGENPLVGSGLKSLVYISVDTLFDVNDRLLGSVTTEYVGFGVGGSVQQSLVGRVSGLAMGEYYLIVKTDVNNAFNEVDVSNNSTCSPQPFAVTVRQLPFNADVMDTLVNNEVSDFMLTVGENTRQTVRIHLHSEDSLAGAYNQLYATHNQIGDNLNYNYSTLGQYTANPELYIPFTLDGYYGVNVYGYSPAREAQPTILRADILPFTLMSVNADHGSNTGEVTVELTGSRFRPDMLVSLRNGNDTIWADTLIYESYYQTFVRFNLAGKDTGVYDVAAVNFCEGEAVLPSGFTIEEEAPYNLGYDLIIPGSPRPKRSLVMMLEFGNIGNVDLHNQVLEISSVGGCPIALRPEDVRLNQKVLRIPLTIEGEPEGLLRPGSNGNINIYTYTSSILLFSIKPVKNDAEQ